MNHCRDSSARPSRLGSRNIKAGDRNFTLRIHTSLAFPLTKARCSSENQLALHPFVNPALNKKPACLFCHKRKIKCNSQWPCDNCNKRGIECEYGEVSAEERAKVRSSRMMTAKLDKLVAELELQRQAAEYWQRLCEQKTQTDDNSIMLSITRRPVFSGSGAKLVQNTCDAVSKCTAAFYELMEGLMPHTSAAKFCPQYAALIWNRLIDSLPEDAQTIMLIDKLIAANILMISSIFAVGLCLINELELSRHFYRLSIALLNGFTNYSVYTEEEIVPRVMLSYVYCMFYGMVSAEFSSILPLWNRAAELFVIAEKNLAEDPAVFDEIVCTMVIIHSEQALRNAEYWMKKLESAITYECNTRQMMLWKNIARVTLIFPSLTQLSPQRTQYMRELWDSIRFEPLLQQLRNDPNYHMYVIWVYSAKGLAMVNTSTEIDSLEVMHSTTIVEQSMKQINKVQQLYFVRGLEYSHYRLATMQQQAPDNSAVDLMIDHMETLMLNDETGEPSPYTTPSSKEYSVSNNNTPTNRFDISV